jgi:predicted ATPase
MNNNTDKTLFSLEVEKLGIIRNAKIDVKPFTIFFGKNNTGKTYLAYLVYGVCSRSYYRSYLRFINPIDLKPIEDFLNDFIEKKAKRGSKSLETEVMSYEYSISKELVDAVFNNRVSFGSMSLKLYNLPTKVKVVSHVEVVEKFDSDLVEPSPEYFEKKIWHYTADCLENGYPFRTRIC